jgi:Tfp pilus assembly protein PilN
MHELEFLPPWYPQLRRRRRLLMLQGWATVTLACGLALWGVLANQNIAKRKMDNSTMERQLLQSRTDLKELNEQVAQKDALMTQQKIVDKVGLHVETARLLGKLDQIMPKEMSLTETTIDTVEQVKQADGKPADAKNTNQEITRKLNVHVRGVTPGDADWASVLAKLSNVAFFKEVRLVNAQDKIESGHLMREFELSFVVDLNSGE